MKPRITEYTLIQLIHNWFSGKSNWYNNPCMGSIYMVVHTRIDESKVIVNIEFKYVLQR
jgi:hypothetical protein